LKKTLKGAGARAGRKRKQQVESWENEKERSSISAFQLFSISDVGIGKREAR